MEVVRTSTANVERRQFSRRAVDLAAELTLAGHGTCEVSVSDLSEGGAMVRGAPDAAAGMAGTLRLEGLGGALPCTVRTREADSLHLAFELDAGMTRALRVLLARLETRLAA